MDFQINVTREAGERIEGLSWPDGTPVADDDVFEIAVNNYRAATHMLVPGILFEEGDMPKLLEIDVHGSLGSIREMIVDYIENVEGGLITPECDDNWSIVGIDWDEELHQRAVELLADGALVLEAEDGHLPNIAITEDDVRKVEGA